MSKLFFNDFFMSVVAELQSPFQNPPQRRVRTRGLQEFRSKPALGGPLPSGRGFERTCSEALAKPRSHGHDRLCENFPMLQPKFSPRRGAGKRVWRSLKFSPHRVLAGRRRDGVARAWRTEGRKNEVPHPFRPRRPRRPARPPLGAGAPPVPLGRPSPSG